jgi:hypothetical protein
LPPDDFFIRSGLDFWFAPMEAATRLGFPHGLDEAVAAILGNLGGTSPKDAS